MVTGETYAAKTKTKAATAPIWAWEVSGLIRKHRPAVNSDHALLVVRLDPRIGDRTVLYMLGNVKISKARRPKVSMVH